MQPKKKKKEANKAHEIDLPRNKQTGGSENFEDSVLRDLVSIASAKAGESFDEYSALKPLADQPGHVLEEIVDIHVWFDQSGINDDAGRPVIGFSFSFEFHEFDILRELERLGKDAGAFKK